MLTINGKTVFIVVGFELGFYFFFVFFVAPILDKCFQNCKSKVLGYRYPIPASDRTVSLCFSFQTLINLKDLKKGDRKKLLLTFSCWCKTYTENWLVVFCLTKGIFKLLFCYSSGASFSCSLAYVVKCFVRLWCALHSSAI